MSPQWWCPKVDNSIGSSSTTTTMKAEALGVEVSSNNTASAAVTLLFNNYNAEAGMVIEEIFFTSTTFSGTQRPYTDDQYIILTNNSDHLIYADSLAIVESKFQSDMQWELTPDLMKDAVTVSWLYLIPDLYKILLPITVVWQDHYLFCCIDQSTNPFLRPHNGTETAMRQNRWSGRFILL